MEDRTFELLEKMYIEIQDMKQEIKGIEGSMATKDDIKNMATKDDIENMATKDDIKNMATKDDIKNMATKDDIKNMATKDDIENMATKDDIKNMATKDDIANMATKDDIANMATKDDIARIENKVNSISEQTADLTEFKTETSATLAKISDDLAFLTHKEFQTEKEVFNLKKKIIG